MKKRVTLKDIAHRLNISRVTVSLALSENWKERRVSAKTRQRVLAEVERLGYRPNAFSKLIQGKPTNLVALIMPNEVLPVTDILRYSLVRRLEDAGLKTILTYRRWDPESPEKSHLIQFVNDMIELIVDSMIIIGSVKRKHLDAMELLSRQKIPTVLISPDLDDHESYRQFCNIVTTDRVEGGAMAGRHLLELGHRKILAVTHPSSHSDAKIKGLEKAVKEIPGAVLNHLRIERRRAEDRKLVEEFPNMLRDNTAVFCDSDQLALIVMNMLRKQGRRVPEDVSIMGFNDHPDASLYQPPLTTVAQPFEIIAEKTVSLLLRDMKNNMENSRQYNLIRPELVVRKSTARPPA